MKEDLMFTGIVIAIMDGLFAGGIGGIVGCATSSIYGGVILAIVFGSLMLFVKGSPVYA
jgi:hypothetical protein